MITAIPIPFSFADDLQQALVHAYHRSPLLHAQRAHLREIDEQYAQAQAGGRMQANIDASIARSGSKLDLLTGGTGTFSTSYWGTPLTGQLAIVKPIYQGGRIKGLKSQAKASILAARQGLRGTEQQILLSCATAYIDVLRDEEIARLHRENIKVLSRQLYAAQIRFEVGAGTKTDTAQAQTRLANAEIGLAATNAQLAVSRANYQRYIGAQPITLKAPPNFALPLNLSEAQNTAKTNNPQILASRFKEQAAQAGIFVAKSAHRPTVSLNASLQSARETNASVPRSDSAMVGAQLRIPLFAGGANRSKVRAAIAAKERSKFETRDAEFTLHANIAALWANQEATRDVLSARRKQISAAQTALEGVQLEQQVGTRSTLDVLNAQSEYLSVQIGIAQATHDVRAAQYQLLSVLGGFDAAALSLPVQSYNPDENFRRISASPYENWAPEMIKPVLKKVQNGSKKIGRAIGTTIERVIP